MYIHVFKIHIFIIIFYYEAMDMLLNIKINDGYLKR